MTSGGTAWRLLPHAPGESNRDPERETVPEVCKRQTDRLHPRGQAAGPRLGRGELGQGEGALPLCGTPSRGLP